VERYYAILVLSQLVVFTLIGVLFNSVGNPEVEVGKHESIQGIWNLNLHSLLDKISSTYIDQSSDWFPLHVFLVLFDLAQILWSYTSVNRLNQPTLSTM